MKISIIPPSDTKAPLFCQYPRQNSPQPAYVCLDCRSGNLYGDYNTEIGNAIPVSIYNGFIQIWGVNSAITHKALTDLLEEIAPLAQEVLDGYSEDLVNGCNYRGVLSEAAKNASEKIESICEAIEDYPENLESVGTCYDWGYDSTLSELWPAGMTLEQAARDFEAAAECVLTDDVEDYLLDRVEREAEDRGTLTEEQKTALRECRPDSPWIDEDE